MEKLLQLLLQRGGAGLDLRPAGAGFVIVFKATHVVNFAHAGR